MTTEQKPELIPHPDPSNEEQAENSINALVWSLVYLAFTHQDLAQPIQRLDDPDGAVAELVTDWKRTLYQEILATINFNRDMITPTLATVEMADPPLNAEDLEYMRRMARLHEPFQIASVCREDLNRFLSDEEIAQLTDGDMEHIAEKMSDAFHDAGVYWDSLEIHAARFSTLQMKTISDKTDSPPSQDAHREA